MKEVDKDFLTALAQYSIYWAKKSKEELKPSSYETEEEAIINGFVHSLLTILRGDSSINDFEPYEIKQGDNIIGEDEYLPIQYFKIFSELKEEVKE